MKTKNSKTGLTLVELMISLAMIVILAGFSVYVYYSVFLSWAGQEVLVGEEIDLSRALDNMVGDIRTAREITSDNPNEIRFTQDDSTYYIYYLYNAGDTYPAAFSKASYILKKATLSGGISGTFSYGAGSQVISDLVPPPTTDISVSAGLVTIDMSVSRTERDGTETLRYRTAVTPRNL